MPAANGDSSADDVMAPKPTAQDTERQRDIEAMAESVAVASRELLERLGG